MLIYALLLYTKPFKMKKINPILFIVFILFITSCGKVIEKLAQWDMPFEYSVEIPAIPTIGTPITLQSPDVATGIGDYLAQNNTASDKITSITLAKSSAEIADSNGAPQNFDFIKSAKLYVKATGMPEAILAQNTNIPLGQSSIVFDVNSSTDLKNYFSKDNTSIKAEIELRQATTVKSIIKYKVTLHVKANPLK
jgi:hypothetical protein